METSLTIKNFKRITDQIRLKNFYRVNYFVGKNASGKSSILNAISYLNDGSNSRHFFKSDSIVDFLIGQKRQYIAWEDVTINPNHTSHKGNLSLVIYTSEAGGQEKGANGIVKPAFTFDNIGKKQFEFINETSRMLELNMLKAEKIIDNDDPWNPDIGTRVYKDGNTIVNIRFLSQGFLSFLDLSNVVARFMEYVDENQRKSADGIFFIFEEPENSLHPELQKKMPHFLNEMINGFDPVWRDKVFFFISTHSPFIISASAKYTNQKTYLIDNGKLLDLNQNIVAQSEGYRGPECAWVVGQMLGSDITDLGYPENYCILEEYSLQVILESAKHKNIIRNIQFISASGASRAVSLLGTISELENMNTLVKCNPYYFDKYYLIIDNTKEFSEAELKRIRKIKLKLKDRFVELSENALEDYYINIDPILYKKSLEEIDKSDIGGKGIIKTKFASLIADKIKNKYDFSKLFKNELDFLLA